MQNNNNKQKEITKQQPNVEKDKIPKKPLTIEEQLKIAQTKVDEITKKCNQYEKIIKENDELILNQNLKLENLKLQINENNEQFKSLIVKKTQDANNAIITKIKELEQKTKNDLEHAKKYAIKDHALKLINIIKQFEIACNYKLVDEKLINYQKGFKIILTMFNNLLNDFHIEIIVPKIGQEFDAKTMECVEVIKNTSKQMKDNIVADVVSNGYKLYECILKPACVKINKNENS